MKCNRILNQDLILMTHFPQMDNQDIHLHMLDYVQRNLSRKTTCLRIRGTIKAESPKYLCRHVPNLEEG